MWIDEFGGVPMPRSPSLKPGTRRCALEGCQEEFSIDPLPWGGGTCGKRYCCFAHQQAAYRKRRRAAILKAQRRRTRAAPLEQAQ